MSWALGSGTVLQGLNSAMIAVALVPIAVQFGDAASIPWVVSGLYVATAVGAPTGGRLADLFGPRRVYLVGLLVVLAAALAGPFVPNVAWLVVDRVVLGLGTALQFPSAMAIIRQQAARRGESAVGALGIIAVCGQTSAALGPFVGGVVVVLWDWPGIFWINLPMVLNAALWVWFSVPADEPGQRVGLRASLRSIDPLGALLFVASLVLLMLGLLSLQHRPNWTLFAVFVPVAVLFVVRELRAATPFVDVRLLAGHAGFAQTCGRTVLTFVSFYCVFYGLPQWLESERDLDAMGTGVLMVPVFAVGVLGTVIATRLGRRVPPRALLVIGTCAMTLAGALIVLFVDPHSPMWLLAAVSALLGVPNGFNNLGNQMILHHSVPEANAGSATGMYRTAQYLGAALSAVIVAHAVRPDEPVGGIHQLGAWVAGLGGVMLVSNLVALWRSRGLPPARL
ncbi:putative arabinose efflux permease, MFS family [Goodfellowiella coeruleoviolacea]|uniref:Arabinose efflux permease, MFS family n=2 Tax=Goodfellowiella coeruleoviolacea TaxID=334858 RepID=A0AAE3GHQ5_9PSEU|nr:putative arabinose efflux permease, MFS family [Goodfellowiella coeruleoviolacea]